MLKENESERRILRFFVELKNLKAASLPQLITSNITLFCICAHYFSKEKFITYRIAQHIPTFGLAKLVVGLWNQMQSVIVNRQHTAKMMAKIPPNWHHLLQA